MSWSEHNVQLPLAIKVSESASFDNFIGADDFMQDSLRQLASVDAAAVVYLWGSSGSGKSHLLQAVCQQLGETGKSAAYLPLEELVQYPPSMLEGMDALPVICVDDLQVIANNASWQQGLFHLFNQVHAQGGRLLFSATASPRELGLELQDLVSRLQWGPVFHLRVLDDEQKMDVLKLRARERGLELEDEPARYLLSRFPRDLNALFEVLDTLDAASMIRQRRITIPFIRDVFSGKSI